MYAISAIYAIHDMYAIDAIAYIGDILTSMTSVTLIGKRVTWSTHLSVTISAGLFNGLSNNRSQLSHCILVL